MHRHPFEGRHLVSYFTTLIHIHYKTGSLFDIERFPSCPGVSMLLFHFFFFFFHIYFFLYFIAEDVLMVIITSDSIRAKALHKIFSKVNNWMSDVFLAPDIGVRPDSGESFSDFFFFFFFYSGELIVIL